MVECKQAATLKLCTVQASRLTWRPGLPQRAPQEACPSRPQCGSHDSLHTVTATWRCCPLLLSVDVTPLLAGYPEEPPLWLHPGEPRPQEPFPWAWGAAHVSCVLGLSLSSSTRLDSRPSTISPRVPLEAAYSQ